MKTCTSITRPESPNIGDTFIELDTEFIIIWTGASWDKFLYGDTFFANTLVGSFDGTGDYLQLGNGILTALSGTNYSISMWYKLDQEGTYMEAFSAGGTTGERVLVYFRARGSGTVSIEFYAGSAAHLIEASPFQSINTWNNAVITVDTGGVSSLYVNGALEATSTAVPQATPTNPVIGCLDGLSNFLDGKIDEVAIFDSTLSATEVAAIYNGVPTDLTSLSPVGWWRMGDGTGDTDLGGGTPVSGDTIGTVVNQGSLGSSANATNSSAALYSNEVPVRPPFSASFDGTDDYLAFTEEDLGSGALTFSAWVNFSNSAGEVPIIADDEDLSHWHYKQSNGYFYIRGLSDPIQKYTSGYRLIAINTWHHMMLIDDGLGNNNSSVKAYIDGTLVGSFNTTGIGGFKFDTIAKSFNAGNPAAKYFPGKIDEVAIWESDQTSNIAAIYNGGVPNDLGTNGLNLSPLHWYRMGNGEGDTDSGGGTPASGDTIGTVVDQGSGSNNATNPNGALYSTDTP